MRKKILITFVIMTMLMLATTVTGLASESTGLAIKIASLSLEEDVRVNFKVATGSNITSTSDVKLLVWEGTPSDINYDKDTAGAATLAVVEEQVIDGVTYQVFQYCDVAAKEMGKTLYACAYYEDVSNIIYSEPVRYSVVQYLDSQYNSATADTEYRALLTSIRSYGAAAQAYFNDSGVPVTEPLYTVNVSNGTFADGFTKGTFLEGETIILTADVTEGVKGWKMTTTAGGESSFVGTGTYEVTVSASATYEPVYTEVEESSGIINYNDLKEAVNAGGEVKLGADINMGENYLSIPANKTVTLDLNGYTLSGSDSFTVIYVDSGAQLTVKDSSANSSGSISGSGEQVIYNYYGTLVIDSGNITNAGVNGVMNFGNATINGGTIKAGTFGVVSDRTLSVTGGKVEGWYDVSLWGGSLKVSDKTAESVASLGDIIFNANNVVIDLSEASGAEYEINVLTDGWSTNADLLKIPNGYSVYNSEGVPIETGTSISNRSKIVVKPTVSE